MRRDSIVLLLLAALAVGIAGCDGGDEEPVERETFIGPAGGVAQSFDRRAQVEVPAGAVDGPQRITIQRATQFPAKDALVPNTAYVFGPPETEFQLPVTISIGYRKLNLPEGAEQSQLALARAVGDLWQPVPGSVVDAGARTVSAPVSGFSTFAIIAGDGEASPGGNVIGPDGGVASSADGRCVVQIPAGALNVPRTITIAPAEEIVTTDWLIEGTLYDCGPAGLSFNETATITISYAHAEFGLGVDESSFNIARATPAGWLPVDGSVADTQARTVSAPVDGFSLFAILGAPLVPPQQ